MLCCIIGEDDFDFLLYVCVVEGTIAYNWRDNVIGKGNESDEWLFFVMEFLLFFFSFLYLK